MSEDSGLKTSEHSSLATSASQGQQNTSKLASKSATEATKSSTSASSLHQTTASRGSSEQNNANNSNGEQSTPTEGDQTAPAPEPVKKFSEKNLQELADYYLNFKTSEIPDSGYVVPGIAGRFPNADNLNELWDNLYHGRDMVRGPDDKQWPLGKFLSQKKKTKKMSSIIKSEL